jgi:glycine/sarcosine N-methyltransferase
VRLHDWDAPDSPFYTVRFFFITETEDRWALSHNGARYRAMPRAELTEAAQAAGFEQIAWHEAADAGYHQPILTARCHLRGASGRAV